MAALSVFVADLLPAAEPGVSFRYDVLPVLSRHGCSSGACHGSPSGKGQFRLSLRGFAPEIDRFSLLREDLGRRTNRIAPASSLLLLKPTMQVAHGGGRQLRESDRGYGVLRRWIAAGCPDDAPDVARCERIEVTPAQGEINWPDDSASLKVRAFFSNGTSRDITHLASFISSHEKVAAVSSDGHVSASTRGETTILVRYLDHVATSDLRFIKPVPEFEWNAPPAQNEIDEIVFARLRKLQIPPSPLSTDEVFLRRVFLDLTGILPERAEAEAFLADTSSDKRARLIDQLLKRPEHAAFLAQKWGDLLRMKRSKMGEAGLHKFHRWLIKAVETNLPYDKFARTLLTARGSTFENPPANFYRAASGVNDAAEATSQLFLGVRIQCAKCHNHPFDQWSQDDYYGIGAVFARVQKQANPNNDEVTIWLDRQSEVIQPRTRRTMRPLLPATGEVEVAADADRRKVFADWLTSPQNPFFARVAVNRIWGHLCGRGIVDPVDDFRADNPPAHPDLLDQLAAHFIASGFDQRAMIRRIANSAVYQLASSTLPLNKDDDRYFSHATSRLLTAEQLLDAISHVTGVPEEFNGLPAATRATSLPSPDFGGDFLTVFGRPARNTVCDCERTGDPKLAQTLELINGPLIPEKLRDPRSRISRPFDDLPVRLKAAGSPPQEGLAGWFRADSGVSIAAGTRVRSGDPVSRWKNGIKDGPHAEQAETAKRPKFVAQAIGGLPAIRFDGTDDLLHNTTNSLVPSGSARTVFVVGRLNDRTGGALVTFRRSRQGGSSVFTCQVVNVGGRCYVYSDGINAAGNTTVSPELLSKLAEPFVATYVSEGVGSKLQVLLNGEDAQPTQPGGIGSDKGVPGFTIGSREDIPPGQQIWNGDISEILIYNRKLSPTEQQRVGSYLATRFHLDTTWPRREVGTVARSADAIPRIISDLYYAAVCRPPTETEVEFAATYVREAPGIRRGLEDVAWALMNSKEFVFQH